MGRHGLLSAAVRLAGWLVVPLFVASACAGYLLELRAGLWDNENQPESLALLAGFGAFAMVGSVLAIKRPANPIGWIMAAIALLSGVAHAGDSYAAYVIVTHGRPDALAVVCAWVGGWYWFFTLALALVYLPLFFPDGRLPSRRWLPLAVVSG